MTPELWSAKKVIDSTIHPGTTIGTEYEGHKETDYKQDTGEPVLLPFRMSAFVLSNLVVTGGMLTPGLTVRNISRQSRMPKLKRDRQQEHSAGKSSISHSTSPSTTRMPTRPPHSRPQRLPSPTSSPSPHRAVSHTVSMQAFPVSRASRPTRSSSPVALFLSLPSPSPVWPMSSLCAARRSSTASPCSPS